MKVYETYIKYIYGISTKEEGDLYNPFHDGEKDLPIKWKIMKALDLFDNIKLLISVSNGYYNSCGIKRIYFIKGLYEPFIKKIREGLFSLIKKDVIQKFTADELELIINGRPIIDVDDWYNNTEYKEPYNKQHRIIKWFWEIVFKLDQKELSNLLMFSTGTSRVPFGGFAALESNRGNLSKFKIEMSEYNCLEKNYIKAHTCFNRLDVPEYDSKEELEEAKFAIKTLGGKVMKSDAFTIPETEYDRTLVRVKKSSNTPAKYPRGNSKPLKNPLKESKKEK